MTQPGPQPPTRKRSKGRIVAVAGNIGAGKSSIVEWLRQHFDVVPFFEPNDDNPYLADFYQDMPRWAFHSQVFFLIRRFRLHRAMERETHDVVQDRTIYEDAEVFATHLHRSGVMDDRDWEVYSELYQTLRSELRPPDLLLYLQCPVRVLVKRINHRGRSFEQNVPTKYLKALDRLYAEWFERYDLSPTLVIDTHQLDYAQNLFDRQELVDQVRALLA
ncbi:MAG: deoxynucleoside kinase [Deltaproteobacteria bacterium HGW-Deltaproteobacteria-20]|nr:MAG: deoxynucleoside kinase [Deltaproteobacteria bacterium HGW-Deltaproteobacteria-20]